MFVRLQQFDALSSRAVRYSRSPIVGQVTLVVEHPAENIRPRLRVWVGLEAAAQLEAYDETGYHSQTHQDEWVGIQAAGAAWGWRRG